jgi:hypothetical protein
MRRRNQKNRTRIGPHLRQSRTAESQVISVAKIDYVRRSELKRNKNDAADAEAICEAVRRPTMRFVRIKSPEQQGQLMHHRGRAQAAGSFAGPPCILSKIALQNFPPGSYFGPRGMAADR